MTKLDVYGGLLGAGKTTLIRRMLSAAYKGYKTAIVENEAGKVNLDAEVLKTASVSVREISSGCICCTVKGSFSEAVRLLAEQEKPDYIVVEPSGAADLAGVVNACRESGAVELNRVIMVVNARRILKLLKVVGDFYLEQLRGAQTIYLNFVEGMTAEQIDGVKETLAGINPDAEMIAVPLEEITGETFPECDTEKRISGKRGFIRCAVERGSFPESDTSSGGLPEGDTGEEIGESRKTISVEDGRKKEDVVKDGEKPGYSAGRTDRSLLIQETPDKNSGPVRIHRGGSRGGNQELVSWSREFHRTFTEEDIQRLMAIFRLKECEGIWRVKGCLTMEDGRVKKVDVVFGDQFQEELEEFPAEKSNILVVTGRTLNLPWLKKRLDALG